MSFHLPGVRPATGKLARRHEQLRRVIGGRSQADSFGGELIDDRRHQRVVAAVFLPGPKMRQKHAYRAPVGQMANPGETLKQSHLENLAGHRGFGHAVPLEIADGTAELGHAQPAKMIAHLGQGRIGVSDGAQAIDFASLASQALRQSPADSVPSRPSFPRDAVMCLMQIPWFIMELSMRYCKRFSCQRYTQAVLLLCATSRGDCQRSSSASASVEFAVGRWSVGDSGLGGQFIHHPLQLFELLPHFGQFAEGGLLEFLIAFGRGGNADHPAPSGTSLVTPAIAPSTARSPMCT